MADNQTTKTDEQMTPENKTNLIGFIKAVNEQIKAAGGKEVNPKDYDINDLGNGK